MLEALPADGTAVLNADDPIVRRMGSRSAARSVTYGFADDADVGAEAVTSAGLAGMRFTLRTDAELVDHRRKLGFERGALRVVALRSERARRRDFRQVHA